MSKYIAVCYHTNQITEDSYKTFMKTKICNRETTLGEIIDWYKVWNPKGLIDDLHISEAWNSGR